MSQQTKDQPTDNPSVANQTLESQSIESQSIDSQGNKDQPVKKKKSDNLNTIVVALVLCLVCSVLVSAVAVGLKPAQVKNQLLDRNKNILVAAGLFDPATDTNADVEARFADFDVKLVDLNMGKYATTDELSAVGIDDVNAYDASQAAKNQALSEDLGENDPASIGRKPKFAKVYVKNDASGSPELVVLPVHGYGLWGTIYGFLTLESDLNTVKGISFYSHKETPGLGARIEEPKWRAQWQGIEVYNDQGEVDTGVTKAGQPKPNPNWVDGISGATLTSRGVNNFIQFWLGDQGYKPFLDNMRGSNSASDANSQGADSANTNDTEANDTDTDTDTNDTEANDATAKSTLDDASDAIRLSNSDLNSGSSVKAKTAIKAKTAKPTAISPLIMTAKEA